MDFADELRQLAQRVDAIRPHVKTEEATKHSLILPFIQLLGYDIFDPNEVVPELTADVGTKKGEKVDYAIMIDGAPAILVEAKPVFDSLTSHDSQLFRYFATTPARFAILTNGVIYRFYSDLEETNKMDDTPFLEFDVSNIKDALIPELKKFCKESFDSDTLPSDAANLKYMKQIRDLLDAEVKDPSAEFCRYFLREIMPKRPITQYLIDRFQPLVKRAFSVYINEMLGETLKNAIATTSEQNPPPASAPVPLEENQEREKGLVVTTQEEIESLFIVKSLLKDVIGTKRVTMKDTASYCSILLDNSTRQWICRLYYGSAQKSISLPREGKAERRTPIKDVEDLYKYGPDMVSVARRYLDARPKDSARVSDVV